MVAIRDDYGSTHRLDHCRNDLFFAVQAETDHSRKHNVGFHPPRQNSFTVLSPICQLEYSGSVFTNLRFRAPSFLALDRSTELGCGDFAKSGAVRRRAWGRNVGETLLTELYFLTRDFEAEFVSVVIISVICWVELAVGWEDW